MIRPMQPQELDDVLHIWLRATKQAHRFIEADYWEGQFNVVKDQYFPQAKTFVYEQSGQVQGFISLLDNSNVGALFVCPSHQNHGIGTELLRFVQKQQALLSLTVYKRNARAVRFYEKMGFAAQSDQIDEETGEAELRMQWSKATVK